MMQDNPNLGIKLIHLFPKPGPNKIYYSFPYTYCPIRLIKNKKNEAIFDASLLIFGLPSGYKSIACKLILKI